MFTGGYGIFTHSHMELKEGLERAPSPGSFRISWEGNYGAPMAFWAGRKLRVGEASPDLSWCHWLATGDFNRSFFLLQKPPGTNASLCLRDIQAGPGQIRTRRMKPSLQDRTLGEKRGSPSCNLCMGVDRCAHD